ncbi:hypothetical protein WOC76_03605 [Methylocystis sp. IM3]|uniref:lipase family protein n=1 Tax=unclassified Methylocystis TaxID=2625913 RepID=UPI000F9CE64C|nr:MAG: hypothetical protein EKK29_07965 [Hyphomicrobiales bacterium]
MAGRAVARALFALLLLLLQRTPSAASESVDLRLAYVLATASYCAYAVNQADADFGRARAVSCLRAAAREDPEALAPLIVALQDTETYVAPDRPEDAYLLVRMRKGLILAFRGTAPPPVLTDGAARDARRGVHPWRTFVADILNDLDAIANGRGRHSGFDDSWERLKGHLLQDCGGSAGRGQCSRFRRFVGRMRHGGALYLTGHSKGGALAMLAGLDGEALAGPRAATQVVYAFAAPKAVTAAVAAEATLAGQGWMRFERENDIVPSLPPDATLPLWIILGSPYAHIGDLVYFTRDGAPVLLRAERALIVPPGDWARAPAFLVNQAATVVASWLTPDFPRAILNSSEAACRALVDAHFEALADVQRLATDNPAVLAAGKEQSFFARGLYDPDERQILWGFREWCAQARLIE